MNATVTSVPTGGGNVTVFDGGASGTAVLATITPTTPLPLTLYSSGSFLTLQFTTAGPTSSGALFAYVSTMSTYFIDSATACPGPAVVNLAVGYTGIALAGNFTLTATPLTCSVTISAAAQAGAAVNLPWGLPCVP